MKEKEKTFMIFPPKVSQVSLLVQQFVHEEKMSDMIAIQQWAKDFILHGNTRLPTGLKLSLFIHKQEKHDLDTCSCDEGIRFFHFTIHLGEFMDNGLLTLKIIFHYGFIKRIVITSQDSISQLRTISWRLARVCHEIFEHFCKASFSGFLNITCRGIPPSHTTTYPNEARYFMLINYIPRANPSFTLLGQTEGIQNKLKDHYNILTQIQRYRAFVQGEKQFTSRIIHRPMIFEEQQIKCHMAKPILQNISTFLWTHH